MSEPYSIVIPQLGVNDEFAVVAEWYVEDRSYVEVGTPICCIETSKATMDLLAERSGYVIIRVSEREEIRIGEVIGYIADSPDVEIVEPFPVAQEFAELPFKGREPVSQVKATAKARQLAEQYGVTLEEIKTSGIVREKDVEAFMSERVLGVAQRVPQALGELEPLAIYGAGLGGRNAKECVEAGEGYRVVYFADDDPTKAGRVLEGIPIASGQDIEKLLSEGVSKIFIEFANGRRRCELKEKLESKGFELVNVIHPTAYIAKSVRIGRGNFIKSGVVLDTGTAIGDCCIIDNNVIIAHDSVIEDGCHLAPGVTLGSSIRVGAFTIIGIGASVSTRVNIGRNVIVSVGTSVVRDVPDNSVIEGVPGKIIGKAKR